MKVLVINCGSSSLKYQLIDMSSEESLAQGLVERIGINGSILTQKVEGKDKYEIETPLKDHQDAIELVLRSLVDEKHGVIKSMDEISAVGHRVVHGGEKYASSVVLDETVIENLDEFTKLAPLHNPPNIIGINACKALMPKTPMVAVFDTAFHQTMPEKAFMYPLPYELYEEDHIRRYGFHGTSHKYVAGEIAKWMHKDVKELKTVTCHIGNGVSVTAVDGGISGVGTDFRDIRSAVENDNNHRALLAMDIFGYQIRKQIGAYAAVMGGVDAIVFTAGIGEHAPEIRSRALVNMEFLGIEVDLEKNESHNIGDGMEISKETSKVKVVVIPTNEELMIAKETLELVQK